MRLLFTLKIPVICVYSSETLQDELLKETRESRKNAYSLSYAG